MVRNSPIFDPATVVAGLPHLPGVYRMLNQAGEVLYVGKALDLRKRVASYFQKPGGLSPRIQLMLGQVAAVETTVTHSEGEALLLESNLIKGLTPRYNIVFRDDKTYPFLMLSGHRYPRLGFHRGGLDQRNRYFGPFPNAGAVRESIQLVQKAFRIRTCQDSVFSNRSRPCLLHQIRRCTAPCVGLVDEASYADDVANAVLFLSGKQDEVLDRLVSRMDEASAQTRYEDAAVLRDQIAALRKVLQKQFVSGQGDDTDVIAFARDAGVVCVNLAMIRGGRHVGDRNFFPRNAGEASPEQVLEAFVAQHYAQHSPPPVIVVGARIAAEPVEQLLAARETHRVKLVTMPGGPRKTWLEMAEKNARLAAAQALGMQATQENRLSALQQALDLPETAQRVECFDISHTMGEATVASCVVYERSAMQKGEYRHFNIQGVEPGDDYGAMREVLSRRYRKVVAGEGRVPDLVLIDGGKGQLAVASEVFADYGLHDVALVAVAKGEERRPGLEQLFRAGRQDAIVLAPDHPALHLIQQIRDEAHRFAIQGHRARRAKARSSSPLESIAGIGARRRQKLLARFGGLRGLLAASIDDLAQVEGIGRTLAEKIHSELH
jgi:excinuclease ABC subunit C